MDVNEVARFLENYRGRDKVYRLVCYSSNLLSACARYAGRPTASERFSKLGAALSSCRLVLRLGDDLSMFLFSSSYGLGQSERNIVLRWLNVLKNVCDQIYYPLEHIAWAGDLGLWAGKSTSQWWTASIAAWASSLLISVIISLIRLAILTRKLNRRQQLVQPATPEPHMLNSSQANLAENEAGSCHHEGGTRDIQSLFDERRHLMLSAAQNTADLLNAVHWMPKGFLWGGWLPDVLVGLNGTLSSGIGLFELIRCQAQQQHKPHDS